MLRVKAERRCEKVPMHTVAYEHKAVQASVIPHWDEMLAAVENRIDHEIATTYDARISPIKSDWVNDAATMNE